MGIFNSRDGHKRVKVLINLHLHWQGTQSWPLFVSDPKSQITLPIQEPVSCLVQLTNLVSIQK